MLVAVALACRGGGTTSRDTASAARAAPATPTPSPAAAPASPGAASDAWTTGEVVKRLTEAGLVVTDSGQRVHHPGLHVEGERLHLGDGELELYLYPDGAARRRDAAAIDTVTHGLPSIYAPRYIASGNLFAILHTPHDRTAERVANTLTARHNGG